MKIKLTFLATFFLICISFPVSASVHLLDSFGGPLGYGENCLYHNDDGSSYEISLENEFPNGLKFFHRRHNSVYVNTNGNISFSAPLPQYTPEAFPIADEPIIAPYWADVDIRFQEGICDGPFGHWVDVSDRPCQDPPENGVWWHVAPGLMVITWDRVGYFDCNMDKRMSFQLILREAHVCGDTGDFDVEFRFNRCEWTTGDDSGGTDGFGGVAAQSGFDAGDGVNYVEIPGSRTGDIHNIMCNQSNAGEPGLWRFEIRGGVIGGCEGAGEACDTGLMGLCSHGINQCEGFDTVCTPLFEPSQEICSGMDEDCDGVIDNGDDLCEGMLICNRGWCVTPCFEFGCTGDQVCGPDGVCVDQDCLGIECPPHERCLGGVCVDACQGVICPYGQECHAGRCVDYCEIIECDDQCEVCENGICIVRCEWESCPPQKACAPEGYCIEHDCVGVSCNEGFYCRGGTCVDACESAVCPYGEVCRLGRCVPGEEPVSPGNGNGSNQPEPPVDPEKPDDPVPSSGSGCACNMNGNATGMSLILICVLLAGIIRRYRFV